MDKQFKSKIALVRSHLSRSVRGLSDGYIMARYPEDVMVGMGTEFPMVPLSRIDERYRQEFQSKGTVSGGLEAAEKLVESDKYCHWLAIQGTSIEEHYPVVIDFSEDLMEMQKSLSQEEFNTFMKLTVEEFANGTVHYPFEDFVIHLDGIEMPDGRKMYNCLVRVRNCTEDYKIKQTEEVDKLIEVSLYAARFDDEEYNWHYAPACVPVMVEMFKDEMVYQCQLSWEKEILEYLYPVGSPEEIKEANAYAITSMEYVLCLFLFFYKHQRVQYREVSVPQGLAKKRSRKAPEEPYTRYMVSSLGDYTQTVYTENKAEKRPKVGTAMHIRRGHYQLWPNHRKLPAHLQKRTWVPSTVVGDPAYGILIRDYATHLAEGEEVTPEKIKEIVEHANADE